MPATLLTAERLTHRHGDRTLFDAVELRISDGERVALVGPNGAGKSTLLRILAGVQPPEDGTVHRTGTVLLLAQPGRRPTERRQLRSILAEHAGIGARTKALDAAAEALSRAQPDRLDAAVAEHAAALDAWLAAGGPTWDADLLAAADRVGLPAGLLDRELAALSSGQAARAALLTMALTPAALLLLDEPSNHLDRGGRRILDELIASHRGALVVASHDRSLLTRHARRVVEIDPHLGRLTEHSGGWAAHEREQAAAARRAREAYTEAIERREELRTAEREIRRRSAATHARVGGNRRDGDKHQREWFRSRADGVAARGRIVGQRAARIDVPERPWDPRPLALALTVQEQAGWLIELDQAVAVRGAWTSPRWSLALRAGDRLLLRGPNGAGKSTLLGLLGGELAPRHGERRVAAGARVAQLGAVEQALRTPDPLASVIARVAGVDPTAARGHLAHVGLGAAHAMRPASQLSQGERTRAELAILGAQRISVLLLDEPTDHLDLASVGAVEAALDGWPGALVVATHDERFAERLRPTEILELSGPAEPARRARSAAPGPSAPADRW